jgi:hypothetical protein
VTLLFAFVNATVELTLTEIAALEHARPAFDNWLVAFDSVFAMTLPLVSAITTKQLLLDLPTIALGWHPLFTGTAESFVARPWASVLAARHHLVAHFAAAPSGVVISVGASFRNFVFSTEAYLHWTHMRTRRAWSSVAGELTGMRAFSGSLSSARLPARMRWNASEVFRINFLLAPTGVVLR